MLFVLYLESWPELMLTTPYWPNVVKTAPSPKAFNADFAAGHLRVELLKGKGGIHKKLLGQNKGDKIRRQKIAVFENPV